MPNSYLLKLSKEMNISIDKLEKYWDDAKKAALKTKKESDEGFYGYVTSIFQKMIGKSEKVSEENIIDLTDAFYEYICEEGEVPTQSADIAQPDKMLFGKPLFRVSKDMFMKIGCQQRGRGWYQHFYGTKIGEWAKNNKGKDFCIQDEETDFIYDVARDKHKKNEKEINLDEKRFK